MKKLYLFLAMSVISLYVYSADNPTENKKVFASDSTVWHINGAGVSLAYALMGEMTVNGKLYNKLYAICDTTITKPLTKNHRLMGGFREEDEKVWFLPINRYDDEIIYMPEHLMYDFSAKTGDEFDHQIYIVFPIIPIPDYFFNDLMDITTTVESAWVDNKGKRHLSVNSYGLDEWVEGIGSLKGLFWDHMTFPVGGGLGDPELLCVKRNEKIIYLREGCTQCFEDELWNGAVNLQPTPAPKIEILLSPNPVNDQLNIAISDEVVPCTFNVFTTTGEYVTGKRLTKAQDQLSMMGMKAGLYIYRMVTDGGELLDSGKVIKE